MASNDPCTDEDFGFGGAESVLVGDSQFRLERIAEEDATDDEGDVAGTRKVTSAMTAQKLTECRARVKKLHDEWDSESSSVENLEEEIRKLEEAADEHASTKKAEKAALRARERRAQRVLDVRSLLEGAKAAEAVMLCFLVDCTGSMARFIEAVKRDVRELASEVGKKYENGKLRVAFVGYRDFCDGEDLRIQALDFTEDIGAFETFLAGIRATGGGDAAEDVVGGLLSAAALDWDAMGEGTTRILMHIADAPAHGQRYHSEGLSDDYATELPPGGATAVSPMPPLRALRDAKVHYYFSELTICTQQMIKVFNEDMKCRRPFITMVALDPADAFAVFAGVLANSVMRTVSGVMASKATWRMRTSRQISDGEGTAGDGGATSCAADSSELDEALPEWSALPLRRMEVFGHKALTAMRELHRQAPSDFGESTATDGTSGRALRIRIAERPFAEGACRLAYHARLGKPDVYKNYVVKRFKDGKGHQLSRYRRQVEESSIAGFLATQFNAWSGRPAGAKPVRFVRSYVFKVPAPASAAAAEPVLYAAEKLLPISDTTPFMKFCNNAGHWRNGKAHGTLMHFIKYTYAATNKYLMVVDLQGVETEDGYYLTDPAILCEDEDRFERTNLGGEAMHRHLVTIDSYLHPRPGVQGHGCGPSLDRNG